MKQITRTYILLLVVQNFSHAWFFSTYVLFILDNGLTLFHANMLNTIFMVLAFLLDPPTGVWADRFGQKRIYVWGQMVVSISMFVYWLGNRFFHFALAEAIAAFGLALVSGALDSWLRNNTSDEICHETISKAGYYASLATIPSAFLGGVIGEVAGLRHPWLLTTLCTLINTCLSYSLLRRLPEGKHKAVEEEIPSVKEAVTLTWQVSALRFSALVGMVSAISFQAINMFWTPIMKEQSGSSWWLGSLWIGVALATSLGSKMANSRFLKVNGWGLCVSLLFSGVPILFSPFLNHRLGILVATFLWHELGRGALNPTLFTYANKHIPNRIRSTANSVRSSTRTLGSAIGLLVSGYLTLFISPLTIWGLSALALIVLALYVIRKEKTV